MSDLPHRLAHPSRRLSLNALMDEWFAARIAARIPGCAALAHDCVLLRRIRGAVGAVLLEGASPQAIAGKPCPWDPPCGLDVLFREQGRVGRQGIPKPYVLATDRKGQDLVVTMTLFGIAADWAATAAHALAVALQTKVDWPGQRAGTFVPDGIVQDLTVRSVQGVRNAQPRPQAELEFLTPMNAEGDNPLERPGTVLARLALRIEGLARWHDVGIDEDWEQLGIAWNAACYDVRQMQHRPVTRRSGRGQAYFTAPTVQGKLWISEFAPELWPLLAIGAETHVGKGATEGFGRFELA